MKNNQWLLVTILSLQASLACAQYHVDTVGLGWARNSVNTAVFRKNALTSYDSLQFTAYYDSTGNLILAKRVRGQKHWIIAKTAYHGNVKDAHNVISISADGNGYLHVAWDHHNDSIHYARSVTPCSLELSAMEPMIGSDEASVTYPEFFKMPSGDLIFIYRNGQSGRGNLVMNYYSLKTRRWQRIHSNLVDGEGKRSAYWQAFVDRQGTLHLSWVWRESWDVASNHDLCYARSRDNGVTWEKISGEQYNLPITLANGDYAWRIAERSELINQTSMFVDDRGRPYIASYWKPSSAQAPQYFIIWHDGKRWQQKQIGKRTLNFSLSGGGTKKIPISRPQVLVEENETIHFLFRDEALGNKPCEYIGKLNSDRWKLNIIIPVNVGSWEPTYDIEAFRLSGKISIFVQRTGQGDGEKLEGIPAQPVMVIDNNGSR
jgi:hypothetical protein